MVWVCANEIRVDCVKHSRFKQILHEWHNTDMPRQFSKIITLNSLLNMLEMLWVFE